MSRIDRPILLILVDSFWSNLVKHWHLSKSARSALTHIRFLVSKKLIKSRWRKGLFQQNIPQNNCVVVQFVMSGIYESDRTVSGEFADFPEL
jgi:hypothetical protein